MRTPVYRVELRIDGRLVGDVRKLAQNLNWTKRRTRKGADEINFSINDVLFSRWLNERNYTVAEVLKPYALDCRIVRDGIPILGGFLATMPAYRPNDASSTLALRFDGYLNLLDGVYIYPTATTTATMDTFVKNWIALAETRSTTAGKAFGFTAGTCETLAQVERTFDGYMSVKHAICNNCDNVEGAGEFDVEFFPNRSYTITSDANYGSVHTDYVIKYPTSINSYVAAVKISAPEVDGFASKVIAVGSGEVSADSDLSTAITSEAIDTDKVEEFGYCEKFYQNSSISEQTTLNQRAATELSLASNVQWQPRVVLSNFFIKPAPASAGDPYIWIGDTITIQNAEDLTGQTSGSFRVMSLSVKVSATGAETIEPELERVA